STDIAADAVNAATINLDVAGDGLVQNGTTGALDVNVDDSTIEVNTDQLRVKPSTTNGQVLTTLGGNVSWQSPLTSIVIGMGHVNADASSNTLSSFINNVSRISDPGVYTVTFNTPISTDYIVQLTVNGTTSGIIQVANQGANSFEVHIFNTSGNPQNSAWQFMVIQFTP
ncbi:hypothetical protein, partial [Flagellimonas oceanensis]|uniref:hypothetical protein n=1 Tax=Flagellimonas oceanensis TaxID=2499163 RepID=UPI0013DF9F2C